MRRPAEEAAAGEAPKSTIEEEGKQLEEAIAATVAQNKRYDEIAGVTASSKLQTEELEHKEAVIAETSVKILKRKVTSAGVPVTIEASKAGTVTICGPGLKRTVAKVAAGGNQLRVALSGAGKTERKHHKKVEVIATLDTSLTAVSASKTLKL